MLNVGRIMKSLPVSVFRKNIVAIIINNNIFKTATCKREYYAFMYIHKYYILLAISERDKYSTDDYTTVM